MDLKQRIKALREEMNNTLNVGRRDELETEIMVLEECYAKIMSRGRR